MNKHLLRLALWLIVCIARVIPAGAQTQVTIGTGTGSGTSTPISRFYEYSLSESIYLGSEFGGNTGNITAIAYDKASGSSTSVTPSVSIYMKLTTNSTVGTSTYPLSLTGYTLVWSGSFPNGAPGWQEVTLDAPFPFPAAGQHLSVAVLNNSGAVIPSGRPQYRYTTTNVRQEADYTGSSAWDATKTLIPHWERPNVRFTLGALSSCLAPSAITVGTVTATTAQLSWTAPAVAPTAYEWEIRTTGLPGSGAAGLVNSGTTTATTLNSSGLPAATTSYFYIRSQCGSGQYSLWSGGAAVVTPCAPVTTFPWTAGFDNLLLPDCWFNTSNANRYWEFVTADAGHGATLPHSGAGMARVDVYNAITANNPMRLVLPPMTIGSGMELQYWAWIGNEGAAAPLSVEVSANGGSTYSTLYSHNNTSNVNQWQVNTQSLAAYAGQTILIRFSATSNYGTGSCNLGLDDITVQAASVSPVVIDSVKVKTVANAPATINSNAGSLQLNAFVYPASASQAVSWSIVPVSGAATINTSGVVTASGNGTVWAKAISVTDVSKKDSLLVTISGQTILIDSVKVKTVANAPAVINSNAGSLQLNAFVYPASASQSVSWSIVPVSGAATLNASGLVTAAGNGTVWAKAISVADSAKKDSLLVTISGQTISIDSVKVKTVANAPAVISSNGGSLQLNAFVYPASASQAVSWSIVPVSGAATINASGLVTASANGTVWAKAVSVANTAKKDSLLVTISGQTISIDSVKVKTVANAPAVINSNGGSLQLNAFVYPASANQAVTWSIVPVSGAATINASGLVTASANGTVWAKAVSVANTAKKDSLLVTISGQTLSIDSVKVKTVVNAPAVINNNGGSLQLNAFVYPASASQSVTWSIVPVSGAATINTSGLVTASGNGTVWAKAVSVANTAKKDSLLVTISGQTIAIDSVKVKTVANVPAVISSNGGSLQLNAFVYPASASQSVSWSIVPVSGGATINASGLVTATGNGTVWAKAVAQGNTNKRDSIRITITGQGLGIADKGSEIGLYIFPNPARDVLTLHIEKQHPDLTVRFTDSRGVCYRELRVKGGKDTRLPVNMSNAAPGIYFITITGKDILLHTKVSKQ